MAKSVTSSFAAFLVPCGRETAMSVFMNRNVETCFSFPVDLSGSVVTVIQS